MNQKRMKEIVALIGSQPVFPFEVRDVEEDLPVILAFFGIFDELLMQEEFEIQEALVAMACEPEADTTIAGHVSAAPT